MEEPSEGNCSADEMETTTGWVENGRVGCRRGDEKEEGMSLTGPTIEAYVNTALWLKKKT